jgi:glycosyltransferase involved in cell wall biosynthesis
LRATGTRVARIYTPHGGSLHFDAQAAAGRVFFAAERLLGRLTDAFIFVSRYEAETYAAKVGAPRARATVVPNGLRPEEFGVIAPNADAADFLFVGALRDLKGPDVLIEALAIMRERGSTTPTAVIVGGGSDKPRYVALAAECGLADAVTFRDPMPARQAFALGRVMVVPSRAESMPYIVLETIAAGVPLITTAVGGIPEIFGAESGRLVPPGDAGALAAAMTAMRDDPTATHDAALRLREQIRPGFSVSVMSDAISGVYRDAMSG